jgi:hypothetical protein
MPMYGLFLPIHSYSAHSINPWVKWETKKHKGKNEWEKESKKKDSLLLLSPLSLLSLLPSYLTLLPPYYVHKGQRRLKKMGDG